MTYLEISLQDPPPPTDNCVFVLRTVKKILITAISENSSFLAKSLYNTDIKIRVETLSQGGWVKAWVYAEL